ncbi:MAG: LPXTG cell wall anchor domain-containing protein, partial [Aeromicrobium sp.]
TGELTLNTQVSDAQTNLDQPFHDTATLNVPDGGPTPTGVIAFRVFGPDNDTCEGTEVFNSFIALSGDGTTANSDDFAATTAGTYHWIASYSGDNNYDPINAPCNEPGETTVVVDQDPPIVDPDPSNPDPSNPDENGDGDGDTNDNDHDGHKHDKDDSDDLPDTGAGTHTLLILALGLGLTGTGYLAVRRNTPRRDLDE